MIEYNNSNTHTRRGGVSASIDHSWRDLSGGVILPGFVLKAIQLEMSLSPDSGWSSEEFEEPIVCPACGNQPFTWSQNTAHSEWHRFEVEKRRYLQRQQYRAADPERKTRTYGGAIFM